MIRKNIWLVCLLSWGYSQIDISATPAISQKSWLLPVGLDIELTENITVSNLFDVFHVDYPFDRPVWYRYRRGSYSMATEISNVKYNNGPIQVVFGRDYIGFGPGKLSGLFLSPRSPSLDHLDISLTQFKHIDYKNLVIRLDNRETIWDGQVEMARRWLYMKSVGINWGKFSGGLIDAVVSTGFDRGIEWYYLTPLSSLFMERKHQLIWREGGDSTSAHGIGDNDNHFVGGYWDISFTKGSFYGEWLVDEWQLSAKYRPNMQTVYALLAGGSYSYKQVNFILEYTFGSPWLYLSRGLYNSPEYHGLPLGLERPNMQGIAFAVDYSLAEGKSLYFEIHLKQSGDQTLATRWDAWDNKMDLFSYSKTHDPEINFSFSDKKGKYFQKLELKYNWLGTGSTQILVGWEKEFSY